MVITEFLVPCLSLSCGFLLRTCKWPYRQEFPCQLGLKEPCHKVIGMYPMPTHAVSAIIWIGQLTCTNQHGIVPTWNLTMPKTYGHALYHTHDNPLFSI